MRCRCRDPGAPRSRAPEHGSENPSPWSNPIHAAHPSKAFPGFLGSCTFPSLIPIRKNHPALSPLFKPRPTWAHRAQHGAVASAGGRGERKLGLLWFHPSPPHNTVWLRGKATPQSCLAPATQLRCQVGLLRASDTGSTKNTCLPPAPTVPELRFNISVLRGQRRDGGAP